MSRKYLTQSRRRETATSAKNIGKGRMNLMNKARFFFPFFQNSSYWSPGSQIRMCFCGVAERFESVAFIFRILNQNGISCTMIYFLSLVVTLKKNIYNFNKNKTRTHSNGVFPLVSTRDMNFVLRLLLSCYTKVNRQKIWEKYGY